jgi:hypothetical protein
MSTREYRVTWVIEVQGESPRDAAEFARECHLDPESEAVVFHVTDVDSGRAWTVDLLKNEMKNEMKIALADIVTAFDDFTIGSKVTDRDGFFDALTKAIEAHDFSTDRIPGQAFIVCPDAIPFVSAGDGKRTDNPEDYIPALHRGQVGLYLKREKAGEVQFCAAVVYTKEAYLKDPDVTHEEAERIGDADYVLVAVIASSGPESPLSPYRFVHNLAGGNREAQVWTGDEIRDRAKDILAHANEWATVAG